MKKTHIFSKNYLNTIVLTLTVFSLTSTVNLFAAARFGVDNDLANLPERPSSAPPAPIKREAKKEASAKAPAKLTAEKPKTPLVAPKPVPAKAIPAKVLRPRTPTGAAAPAASPKAHTQDDPEFPIFAAAAKKPHTASCVSPAPGFSSSDLSGDSGTQSDTSDLSEQSSSKPSSVDRKKKKNKNKNKKQQTKRSTPVVREESPEDIDEKQEEKFIDNLFICIQEKEAKDKLEKIIQKCPIDLLTKKHPKYRSRPLSFAAIHNNVSALEILGTLIKQTVNNIDEFDRFVATAIDNAVYNGAQEGFSYIFSSPLFNPDIFQRDEKNVTLLHLCVERNHKDMLPLILEQVTKQAKEEAEEDKTVLESDNKQAAVKKFVSERMSNFINEKDNNNRLAIDMAQKEYRSDWVKLLARSIKKTKTVYVLTPDEQKNQDILFKLLKKGPEKVAIAPELEAVMDKKLVQIMKQKPIDDYRTTLTTLINSCPKTVFQRNKNNTDDLLAFEQAALSENRIALEIIANYVKEFDASQPEDKRVFKKMVSSALEAVVSDGKITGFLTLVYTYDANVFVRDTNGQTLLELCIQANHEKMFDQLIKAMDAAIQKQTPGSPDAKKAAAKKFMLELVNSRNNAGETALFELAVLNGNEREDFKDCYSEKLFELGASLDVQNNRNETVFQVLAKSKGTVKFLDTMLNQLKRLPKEDQSRILDNAEGYTEDDSKTPINTWPALMLALLHQPEVSRRPFMRKLLEAGADVNAFDSFGDENCIMFAARKNNIHDLELLLEFKAAVKHLGARSGDDPIHVAIHEQRAYRCDIVNALIKARADVNGFTKDRQTNPVLLACQHNDQHMLSLLMENKAAIQNLGSVNGYDPIHEAIHTGSEEIVSFFLNQDDFDATVCIAPQKNRAGVPTGEVRLEDGYTPLMQAIHVQEFEIFKTILEHYKKHAPDAINHVVNGQTALSRALQENCDPIYAEELLDSGAHVPETNPLDQKTCLHVAAGHGWANVVEKLIAHKGSMLEAVDHKNHTALYYALQSSNTKCIEVLLEAGAQKNSAGIEEALDMLSKICRQIQPSVDVNTTSPDSQKVVAMYHKHLEILKIFGIEKPKAPIIRTAAAGETLKTKAKRVTKAIAEAAETDEEREKRERKSAIAAVHAAAKRPGAQRAPRTAIVAPRSHVPREEEMFKRKYPKLEFLTQAINDFLTDDLDTHTDQMLFALNTNDTRAHENLNIRNSRKIADSTALFRAADSRSFRVIYSAASKESGYLYTVYAIPNVKNKTTAYSKAKEKEREIINSHETARRERVAAKKPGTLATAPARPAGSE